MNFPLLTKVIETIRRPTISTQMLSSYSKFDLDITGVIVREQNIKNEQKEITKSYKINDP